MATTANLGFPRIGAQRELKQALERYWKGETDRKELEAVAGQLKRSHWQLQQSAGLDFIPCGDFSLYDHVLDHIVMFDAVPSRYRCLEGLDRYFAMARGYQRNGVDLQAMGMTKWFDTNYHYIVPEFSASSTFNLVQNSILADFLDAKALGITTRPVVIGPVTFLLLGKTVDNGDPLALLPKLLPAYKKLLKELREAGAEWIQLDEPFLACELAIEQQEVFRSAFKELSGVGPKLMLTSYFAGLEANADVVFDLPIDGVHLDLVRDPSQLAASLARAKEKGTTLSLGVIDGRNIWKCDLPSVVGVVRSAVSILGWDRVVVAPSCSLLHIPIDLDLESNLGPVKEWLSFARQKLGELSLICQLARDEQPPAAGSTQTRANSSLIHNPQVKERVSSIDASMLQRRSAFSVRKALQAKALGLPLLPTSTVGSFPQTAEIRSMRARWKTGKVSLQEYETFMEDRIRACIAFQEEIGIDAQVHGEFERNDMVEYFGEQLSGFAFTANGWVQSYGSRCVKPPIIYGDVVRPKPMTVRWTSFAQSLTDRPVKGMLTGPVTILQWSFVRDDQPREITCKQIALAIRDEVHDLEKAGIRIIQIDEPALREGLPLRKKQRDDYLRWTVESFRLASSGVEDATQIHTHMCYCEFRDIVDAIVALDADVLSIETSRSSAELLSASAIDRYPNDIGPGVYDVHSPRIPDQQEFLAILRRVLALLPPSQLWVLPDCGLKTREWKEVQPALGAMVAAARTLRRELETV